jgi:hypothetical protein
MGSPVLAEKARATNQDRYGDAVPQRTDAVKERQRETNLERWGVPWTGMHPEIRTRQLEAHYAKWGSHYFVSDEGKAKIKQAMRLRYGVDHPSQMKGWWERVVATNMKRHGVPYPVMQGRFRKGPNNLEQKVMDIAPDGVLRFTGDGGYWRFLPLLGRHKNPDFVVVRPDCDPEHPFRKSTKVIEACGDFWHSRMFTGKAPFEHEQELIDAYADVGIQCLIIWESEVKSDPDGVRGRLEAFLSAP